MCWASMLKKWHMWFLTKHYKTNYDLQNTFVDILSTFSLLMKIQLFQPKFCKIWPLWKNAHRSGMLVNFVIDDNDKQMVAEDGNIVITVCNHKTSSTHGAATICISYEEGQLLDGYLNMRDCLMPNVPSTHVFLSHTGTPMTQSTVTSALSSLFSNGGYKQCVTCTKLRNLSLIHIWRCRRSTLCRSRWSPYH